jgi:thioredoxin 1
MDKIYQKYYIRKIERRKRMIQHLSMEGFKKQVFDLDKNEQWKFEGEKPAIIDFYAEWCGPCKMLGPVLEELATEYAGKLDIYKIDTDKEPELSARFNIQSVPSLLFAPKEGSPSMALGALPKGELVKAIKEVLGL